MTSNLNWTLNWNLGIAFLCVCVCMQVGSSYGRMMEVTFHKKVQGKDKFFLAESMHTFLSVRRTNTINHTNPVRYSAYYFGPHRSDWNSIYGVTHVLAHDGYSGKIVSVKTVAIYMIVYSVFVVWLPLYEQSDWSVSWQYSPILHRWLLHSTGHHAYKRM